MLKSLILIFSLLLASNGFSALKTQCGNSDERVLSYDRAIGRMLKTLDGKEGCSGTLISRTCMISAGHCKDYVKFNEFNVAPSVDGKVTHSGPTDVYELDHIVDYQKSGRGKDWIVYRVKENSLTGLYAGDVQGYYNVDLEPAVAPFDISVTGFGRDKRLDRNFSQQTSVDKLVRFEKGTRIKHSVDSQHGNSGSSIVDTRSGKVIGVHTHGGCGGFMDDLNSGTSLGHHKDFKNAVVNCLEEERRSLRPLGATLSNLCSQGDIEGVKLALESPTTDPNKSNIFGNTPLHQAIFSSHNEIVKLLLSHTSIDVNKQSNLGESPLVFAARNFDVTSLRLLLSHKGIDVSASTAKGDTPLAWAVYSNNLIAVKLLVSRHDVVVNTENLNGKTPIAWAIDNEFDHIFKLLLNKLKVESPAAAQNAWTHASEKFIEHSKKGKVELVKFVLSRKDFDVNHTDKNGATALYWAVENEHIELVDIFLRNQSVLVNRAQDNGSTPLYRAVVKGNTTLVNALLNRPEIDVNAENNYGNTPLIWASYRGMTEVVKTLISHPSIDITKADSNGDTPLKLAIKNGHNEIADLLKTQGNY